jgi:DNA-binding FrmR family transcriptional regulator
MRRPLDKPPIGGYHILMGDSKNKKEIGNRMNYLVGHLKANSKMIEENRYCIDIIRQNQAVIAAIKKVNEIILEDHLNSCVITAVRGKNAKTREKVLREIVQIFKEEDNEK